MGRGAHLRDSGEIWENLGRRQDGMMELQLPCSQWCVWNGVLLHSLGHQRTLQGHQDSRVVKTWPLLLLGWRPSCEQPKYNLRGSLLRVISKVEKVLNEEETGS